MIRFKELSNEQRRQFVDVEQIFVEWRKAEKQFRHSYKGSMRWVRVKERDYLYRYAYGNKKYLGQRTPETEKLKQEYMTARRRLRDAAKRRKQRLEEMAPLNRALRLNRVPQMPARIIRALDMAGLLGEYVSVIGTNALFAYEARAGVQLGQDIVSTDDMDILWDSRKRLSVALSEIRRDGVMSILKRVDRSFDCGDNYGFYATNRNGYVVDLLCQEDIDDPAPRPVTNSDEDISASPTEGLDWIINSPKLEQVAIAEDGRPLFMVCADPRVFALHKAWLSTLDSRNPIKRPRDRAQAEAASALACTYFGMTFNTRDLSALPKELRNLWADLPTDAGTFLEPEESDILSPGW